MLLGTDLAKLIECLREEATDARQCFRTFSVQAIAFAVAAVAGILVATSKVPVSAFGAVGVFIVVVAVQRISIHKMSTANRIYGYQLHLERLGIGPQNATPDSSLAWLGWEEACRAWRIVQATVFDAVYVTPRGWVAQLPPICDLLPRLFSHRPALESGLKEYRTKVARLREIEATIRKSVSAPEERRRLTAEASRVYAQASEMGSRYWWLQGERARLEGGKYHAGSYLARMLAILGAIELFSMLPIAALFLHPADDAVGTGARAIAAVVLLVQSVIWLLNWLSLRRRRQMLEDELLSIHSCAIMWKAVALAHRKAWGAGTDPDERRRYTERLSRVACWYARDPTRIRRLTDSAELPDEAIHRML